MSSGFSTWKTKLGTVIVFFFSSCENKVWAGLEPKSLKKKYKGGPFYCWGGMGWFSVGMSFFNPFMQYEFSPRCVCMYNFFFSPYNKLFFGEGRTCTNFFFFLVQVCLQAIFSNSPIHVYRPLKSQDGPPPNAIQVLLWETVSIQLLCI